MKQFKYFWICSSLVLISGCTGLETKPYSVSTDKTEFMAQYCRSGKQTKAYRISVIYFAPQIEKGIPLDQAAKEQRNIADQKNILLKELFFLLGNDKTDNPYVHRGDWFLLVSDDEKEILENIQNESATTQYKMYKFIVRSPSKIFIYFGNDDRHKYHYSNGYASDLNYMFNNYTLLAPKKVMEEITGEDFESSSYYSFLILNKSGEIDITRAIENRDRVWETYINKFTSLKESSDDNSKRSIVELSLDLNTFCKYGRKISDLQSQ